MEKRLIVRISEGLGNQLFMYANAYTLSKTIDYKLYVDDQSGFVKTKNFRDYYLENFNITANIIDNKFKFNTLKKNIKRKFLKKIDFFFKKKRFILEKKDKDKNTRFENLDLSPEKLNSNVFIEGHFESEKYFKKYRNNLTKEFRFKENLNLSKNFYSNIINQNLDNVVSLCIRTNRYSERPGNKNNAISKMKSDELVKNTIQYINRSIQFLKNKIENPIFLIWSNDFKGLKEYFPEKNFIFVENDKNKIFTDFYLLNKCKTFIVGPTSFHWWGAWLSENPGKMCIRPSNINPSKNSDFWPEEWISI